MTETDTTYAEEHYDNPEAKEKLDAARESMQQAEQVDDTITAANAHAARSDLAGESQPGRELPDLTDSFEVEFRGHTFEFSELGDSVVKAARKIGDAEDADAEAGAKSADFVYEVLADKSKHPEADEAYWRQYDLQHDEMDGVFDLFDDLAGAAMSAEDLDDDERERIEEFRDE